MVNAGVNAGVLVGGVAAFVVDQKFQETLQAKVKEEMYAGLRLELDCGVGCPNLLLTHIRAPPWRRDDPYLKGDMLVEPPKEES